MTEQLATLKGVVDEASQKMSLEALVEEASSLTAVEEEASVRMLAGCERPSDGLVREEVDTDG